MSQISAMAKAIRKLGARHNTWDVFSDFAEMGALSFSNVFDRAQYENREQRYLDIAGKYSADEIREFPRLLAQLTDELESGFSDVLGKLFHELEFQNKWKGQFFTPYHLCRMMAKMNLPGIGRIIDDRGLVTAMEPACGAGAMVIALADEMKRAGINYQQTLHVTAIDIDLRCVHMAYLQLSLLHVPAVVIHGNSLSLEEFSHWYTPAHYLGLWDSKVKAARPDIPEQRPQALLSPRRQARTADIQLDLFSHAE